MSNLAPCLGILRHYVHAAKGHFQLKSRLFMAKKMAFQLKSHLSSVHTTLLEFGLRSRWQNWKDILKLSRKFGEVVFDIKMENRETNTRRRTQTLLSERYFETSHENFVKLSSLKLRWRTKERTRAAGHRHYFSAMVGKVTSFVNG